MTYTITCEICGYTWPPLKSSDAIGIIEEHPDYCEGSEAVDVG